jgi:parallel beta-helix repeat protein
VANICSSNGFGGDGAGIHATGSDNRIEGNNCTDADRGIDVDGIGSIIIKNTCSGNTFNYSIVANNRYGPIINISISLTAAVSGSSAASTLTSTDPWANFAF